MPTFRPRTGYLLVLPDTDEDRSHTGVLFSDTMRRKRCSGICLIHQCSIWWTLVEDPLDQAHIVFEKWAWREIVLGGQELWLVPEQAVFATLEGEPDMNRKELIDSLLDSVRDIVNGELVNDTDELTEDAAAAIDGQMESLASEALALEAEEDDDKDAEK